MSRCVRKIVLYSLTIASSLAFVRPLDMRFCLQVRKMALSLASVQRTAGLDIDDHEYVKEVLNFGLMEVVREWARHVVR